jgi:hypothetical protein
MQKLTYMQTAEKIMRPMLNVKIVAMPTARQIIIERIPTLVIHVRCHVTVII